MNLVGTPLRSQAVVVVLALLAVVAVLVPATASAPPAGAARGMGSTPLDDIRHWAADKAACGLTPNRLAALMLGPIYSEAGTWGEQSPSPMTLGRWDTVGVDKLYAFADKATPYQKAFYHAGIGLWQFDSAGFYPLTAAGAISTWTAAEQAAKTMSARWCASSGDDLARIKYTWGPWYGCAGYADAANPCLAVYDEVFDGTELRNLRLWPEVGRDGGMEARDCLLDQVAVVCHYVDPARAQGYKDWAHPTYEAPAPLSAPFYVIAQGDQEHRFWLAEDTGYGQTIAATKAITANARTANVWSFSDSLCDVTAGRGACNNPFGYLDEARGGAAALTVAGWAIDPDTTGPVDVHVYVDGRFSGSWRADAHRPDVGAAHPGYGDHHGYEITINGVAAGSRTACAYAMNLGQGTINTHLGCREADVLAGPAGFWDVPPASPFVTEVSWVAGNGVAAGYGDGSFQPAQPVSRQAMAAFLQRLYVLLGGSAGGGASFGDVPAGHPFGAEIAWLAGTGITQGYGDGTFHPTEPVSRQAMAAFLQRLYVLLGGSAGGGGASFGDVPAGHPFGAEIAWLAGTGITQGYGDGTFHPTEPVSRQAMAAFLYRLGQLLDTGP